MEHPLQNANSLRNKLPKTQLSDEVREQISKLVRTDVESMQQDRQDQINRWADHLQSWDDFITPSRKGPWDNSANFHIPFTMQQMLGFHARFMSILFDVYPNFYVNPTETADFHKKELNEKLMRWILDRKANRNQGVQEAMDTYCWDLLQYGQAIMKISWDEEYEKFVDVVDEIKEVPGPNGAVIPMKTGNQIEEEVETLVYSGPKWHTVNPLDFYIPGGYTVVDAPVIAERIYLTKDDLARCRDYDHFFKSAIDRLLERQPDSDRMSPIERSVAQEQDSLEGKSTVDAQVNRPAYHIIEWYGRHDVNNDGLEERIIAWVDESSGILLGWNYLNRAIKAGRPPYFTTSFINRRGTPIGLVELLKPINDEMDALHNMRMDSGTLMNIPWGTIKESRTIKSDDIHIRPGVFVPVDEHDDLQVKTLPYNGNFFLQEEQLLMRHGERLGMSDLGQGQVPSQVGPLGTATGTMGLLGEMNKRLGVHIMRLRASWGQMLKFTFKLCREYLPLGTVFRVTGEDGREVFGKIESREDFCSDMDFDFVAPTTALNKELDKQNSMIWLQTASNPLYVQLGLTTPDTLYNALKDVARNLGKQGVSQYVNQAPITKPQSIEEEVSFILSGVSPVIVLNDDHEAKVNGLLMHRDHLDLERAFPDPAHLEVIRRGFDHAIQQHQQMLSAIQAQAQASNISGLQIAPTMSNRMAGGTTSQESPAGEPAPVGGGPNAGSVAMSGGMAPGDQVE